MHIKKGLRQCTMYFWKKVDAYQKKVAQMYNVLLKKKIDAYQKCCAHVQCTFEKRWMNIKKSCAHVQCTVEKRWLHIKNAVPMYNVLLKKNGCISKKVAPMYNVPLIKDGCTQKSCAHRWMCASNCCAIVQCTRWKIWMNKKVVLVYNALNEQDGWKKCCANVPWIKHGSTLCTAVHCTYCW